MRCASSRASLDRAGRKRPRYPVLVARAGGSAEVRAFDEIPAERWSFGGPAVRIRTTLGAIIRSGARAGAGDRW